MATNANHSNRLAASAAGEKAYTGQPCKAGHDGLRYTSSGNCIECSKLATAKRCTGKKPGRPKAPRVAPKPQRHRIVQQPQAQSERPSLRCALADYRNSFEARQRSAHLDNLTRNMIRVPDEKEA